MSERCVNGHERTPESTYVYPSGKRKCRTCRAEGERCARSARAMPRSNECKRGHTFLPETTYTSPDGKRRCVICRRDWEANRRPLLDYYRNANREMCS